MLLPSYMQGRLRTKFNITWRSSFCTYAAILYERVFVRLSEWLWLWLLFAALFASSLALCPYPLWIWSQPTHSSHLNSSLLCSHLLCSLRSSSRYSFAVLLALAALFVPALRCAALRCFYLTYRCHRAWHRLLIVDSWFVVCFYAFIFCLFFCSYCCFRFICI